MSKFEPRDQAYEVLGRRYAQQATRRQVVQSRWHVMKNANRGELNKKTVQVATSRRPYRLNAQQEHHCRLTLTGYCP
jgi:hypothetical protein